MKEKKSIWMVNLLIILLVLIKNAYTKEIVIRNSDKFWDNIEDIVKNNQNGEELVIFRGNKNGTIFDHNFERSSLSFTFSANKEEKLKFENIIFRNYQEKNIEQGIPLISLNSYSHDFIVIFDNCEFQNNRFKVFQLSVNSQGLVTPDYHLIFNNCKFINNLKQIAFIEYKNKSFKHNIEVMKTKFINCKFENNKGRININYVEIEFDHCYFSGMEKDPDDSNQIAIFIQSGNANKIIFNNCIFNDINIKSNLSLINSVNLDLE
ncbi:hypothetical protein PIROE2DRAFT_16648 [Piromyces sp. E2]|nr:hypothetical protein PIROE2DRAFT_16648 [Piromyces sp. E2]|eukprot:OUM58169.1 hypothetical protein PIROE2DRAFT_16648 [Piromyces sp. E2]